jgi:hypothetical protein
MVYVIIKMTILVITTKVKRKVFGYYESYDTILMYYVL